jgi:hypothetical protein
VVHVGGGGGEPGQSLAQAVRRARFGGDLVQRGVKRCHGAVVCAAFTV